MLTKITIRNFKLFEDVEIELGNPVVFVGPNNSGKTTALQALTLWELGINRWAEKRADRQAPSKRTGVAINRRDLYAVPHPSTLQLWRALKVRKGRRKLGRSVTENIRIEIIVEGVSNSNPWSCGLEFDYANPESIYCRPISGLSSDSDHFEPPQEVRDFWIGYLPPMSGLTSNEVRLEQGAIDVRIGEGRTAEVLRNLCFQVATEHPEAWRSIVQHIQNSFNTTLLEPLYIAERGEISMSFRDDGYELDLSATGRGLLQTLLLLVYMYSKSGAVILLDEPDAHLELLRQRQIYHTLTEVAKTTDSQIIISSHSEVVLQEAADKDLVIAFVGKPHPLEGRQSQLSKALKQIDSRDYYQAKTAGWVLYLEGFTDLAMLRAFAYRLEHQAAIQALARPFVFLVGNEPRRVRDHFYGVREALPELRGIALFDQMELPFGADSNLELMAWTKREIENYVCSQRTLEKFAIGPYEEELSQTPLFARQAMKERHETMKSIIVEVNRSFEVLEKGSPWDASVKASDEVLKPVFIQFFKQLELPNLMDKKSFHELVKYVPDDEIDDEITEKLDAIVKVAKAATQPN